MARKQPIDPPKELITKSDTITQVREYKVITPLFGGGVEPGEADPLTVVRATEIRGQLRFWWRATRGGQFNGSLEQMKAAEDALWGAASTKDKPSPSLVQVEVEVIERGFPLIPVHNDSQKPPFDHQGKAIPKEMLNNPDLACRLDGCSKYEHLNKRENRVELRNLYAGSPESIDGYIAFPLRKEDKQQEGGILLEGVTFRLRLRYPRTWPKRVIESKDFQEYFKGSRYFERGPAEEVAAALWAWETFGGVGARTRRGCGAIALERWLEGTEEETILSGQPDAPDQIKIWIKQHLETVVAGESWPPNVPHLPKQVLMESDIISKDPKFVWRQLGQKLKKFRQRRHKGYRGSSFGRSKWPEPDAVRKLTGMYFEDKNDPAHNHKTPVHGSEIVTFPRSAFGLPISFAFQRDQTNPHKVKAVDPTGTNTLEGDHVDHQRLSSPLILRPVQCIDKRCVGLAIVLEGTELPPMQLLSHKQLTANLTSDQAQILRQHGLSEIPDTGSDIMPRDILKAFLTSLKGAK